MLQRRAHEGQFSLERVFSEVEKHLLMQGVSAKVVTAPVRSKGFFDRLRIIGWAFTKRKNVTHITGDITFAAIGTNPRRTVITIHDCEVLDRSSGIKKAIIKLFWYRIPTIRAAAIVVISEATKQKLLKYLPNTPSSKLSVIPSATSSNLSYQPKEKPSKPTRILQIGTKHNKNLPRLIEALRGQPCVLVIIGRLSETTRILLRDAQINFQNRVDISNEELADEYQRCDIVSFVSLEEGFGMPIIEAQKIGRPVITSNCSSMPEVAGEGALLVNPYDVESIRSAFEELIHDAYLQRKLVAAGLSNLKRFESKEIARAYSRVYEAIAKAHR